MVKEANRDLSRSFSKFNTEVSVEQRSLDAVSRLLKQKPFEKMTVLEICREAKISPPTFYNHFSDKYQVAHWLFEQVAAKSLFQIGRTLNWNQGYFGHAMRLMELKDLFMKLMRNPKGYLSLPSYGRRRQREMLIETITVIKGIELTDELKFQIDGLVQLETHTAVSWVKSEMTCPDPATYARYLANAVPRMLFELLNTPVNPYYDC